MKPYSQKFEGRKLDCISFPLGGIGTGMICLGGYGQLREWHVMNRPSKYFRNFFFDRHPNPFCSFFTIKIRDRGRQTIKVLQGPATGFFGENSYSGPAHLGEGLPHFRDAAFAGKFPFAEVTLKDREMPVDATLEAFNPFIPLNDKDSGIPVAVFLYRIRNKTGRKISATIFGNARNIIGYPKNDGRMNVARKDGCLSGLFLKTNKFQPDVPEYGTMALTTTEKARVWSSWDDDSLERFWNVISDRDDFPAPGKTDIGTIAVDFTLDPDEEKTVPFFISWHFPVFEKYWEDGPDCGSIGGGECGRGRWKNYYATIWKDAWDAAEYTAANLPMLYGGSKLFHNTFFGGDLPVPVLEAMSSAVSILKTPTVIRLEDGTFYGFEGCSNEMESGSCPGSCTHVWNYAQAVPWLFPNLQRSMREADYKYAMREDGLLQFRLPLPLGRKPDFAFHPAADGQMGGVIQVYREWLISGDDQWLKKMWPLAKKALEFAWKFWDADKDGVPEGVQHNTYDIEFFGPNTLVGGLYLAALKAAEKMAVYLGDEENAAVYRLLFSLGSAWTDKNLFNGEYYEQKVNPRAIDILPEPFKSYSADRGLDEKFKNWPKCQYGTGCLSDQLLGQWYAEMLDLGYLYDRKNIRKALKSIVRYNFLTDFSDHACLSIGRTFALNEEGGLLVCSWPRGGRPGTVPNFSDEVWTGIEYQVASHLIYEGFVDEGLDIVRAARRRYDGERRNPWDDMECGHYYARAMSAYSLLLALSGFRYSAPEKTLWFAPRTKGKSFASFFCAGSAWGSYGQKIGGNVMNASLEIKYGSLEISRLCLAGVPARVKQAYVSAGGKTAAARLEKTEKSRAVAFNSPAVLNPGDILKILLK